MSRVLRRGGGTAVAGLVGLAIEPGLVGGLAARLGQGCVLVTGTNGKTTTARFIAAAARTAGLLPLANASGSNLMRGLAAALAEATTGAGAVRDAERRIGVFEVDEATVRPALPQLRPRAAVFTNLYRDQLDRYGEVEAVAELWRASLATAPRHLRLVLNADDPLVASLGEGRGDAIYFGIEDSRLDRGATEHAADALQCRCGSRLHYQAAYFGHAGIWRCDSCGRERPRPAVRAEAVDLRDGRSLRFLLHTPAGSAPIELQIGGLYNVYNALAAAAAAEAMGLPFQTTTTALLRSGAAFGRQETFEVEGRRAELFLGKNPAGLNQVLATLRLDPRRPTLLIVLNDGVADGRDISWIWDVDFEAAAGLFQRTVVSGRRAWDMALRLKYAQWDESSLRVEQSLQRALALALAGTPTGACLAVIATYTAMLAVRELLARRSGRLPFWLQGERLA